ncbi:hypothetical protein GCM10023174_07470 [Chelativorans composti]|jgi:hypothetical protein|uniref:Uncharacterized protein n=1 Tax=Chelativorans composti TaxID=768533 RepID=A0ABW5DKI0_9HYPH
MKILFPTIAFSAALILPAHAYLDPGMGSMVLQAIIGAVAVGGAAISVYWNKLKSLFTSKKK